MGLFLGGVFAAMFPDKVERMVSDGNVDYLECFLPPLSRLRPTLCAFYSPTPSQISTRLQNLLASLKTHPIIVPSSDPTSLPEIITYTSLQRLISASLYRPILLFPSLANVLLSLEAGNGSYFIDLASTFGMREPFTCECTSCKNKLPSSDPEDLEATDDAMAAVMCSDGAAGAVNAETRMLCAGWSINPKFRFTGPFKAHTPHPILYIANHADNVTPLRSAKANSANFPASGRLGARGGVWPHEFGGSVALCRALGSCVFSDRRGAGGWNGLCE
ncbi:hypothetical protein DID88_001691 [Monilinia fructigena]|uniref:Peptidase S33 tripeptidyl aminopeptidase-like C-terminal domain-containing protein n=1 Tax=Monilinia fructigena TaxID=38457 RepID=A0A395IY13_9HELO|nr:hypothetical protein DID88_001691 [Monilinia fructigena]